MPRKLSSATAEQPTVTVNEPKPEKDVRRILEIRPEDCKRDHIMAIVHFVKVKDNARTFQGRQLVTEDLDGGPSTLNVIGDELIRRCFSADQFSETVVSTKTKVAELLITSYGRPFTVNFDKQPDRNGVVENRTLRGRLVEPEPLLGRSKVEDLDEPAGKRFRLVDHRTIKYLIVDGIKYVVGK